MSKQKYTHIRLLLPEIKAMLAEGKSHREVEEYFGLTGERPVHHLLSDQGAQYASQAYFELTQSYGIAPSMSSKGNPYDNAMAENFFSILKTECIYRHRTKTLKEDDLIDRYIHFYNHERIQNKTGVAPLTLRHST